MKVYISGKITGKPLDLAVKEFRAVSMHLHGYSGITEVVNPMKEVPYVEGKIWEDYMKDDIKLLLDCDAIWMMNDWKDSKGARFEYLIAKKIGLSIYNIEPFEDLYGDLI